MLELMKEMYMTEEIGEGNSTVGTPSRIGSSRKKKKKIYTAVKNS